MKHKELVFKNGKLKEVDLKSENLLEAIDEMEHVKEKGQMTKCDLCKDEANYILKVLSAKKELHFCRKHWDVYCFNWNLSREVNEKSGGKNNEKRR